MDKKEFREFKEKLVRLFAEAASRQIRAERKETLPGRLVRFFTWLSVCIPR
jgi:hypothetical protein